MFSISKSVTISSGNPAVSGGHGPAQGRCAAQGPGVAGGVSGLLTAGSGGPMPGSMGGALGEGGPTGFAVGIPTGVPMSSSMGGPVGAGPVGGLSPGGPGGPEDKSELSGEEALVKLAKLGGKMAGNVITGLLSAFGGGGAGGALGPK